MSIFFSTVFFFVFLFLPLAGQASTVAVDVTDDGSYVGNSSFISGWSFSVNQSIEITELGFIDRNLNGLNESHDVGIFDSSQSLIISTTVPVGTAATLDGFYRYDSVTPYTLTPGEEYRIFTRVITNYSSGGDAIPTRNVVYSPASQINVINTEYHGVNAGGLFYVTNSTAGTTIMTGNFKFNLLSPVPIPATFPLFAFGIFTIFYISRT